MITTHNEVKVLKATFKDEPMTLKVIEVSSTAYRGEIQTVIGNSVVTLAAKDLLAAVRNATNVGG